MDMFDKARELNEYANRYREELGDVTIDLGISHEKEVFSLKFNTGYECFDDSRRTVVTVFTFLVRKDTYDLDYAVFYGHDHEERIIQDLPYKDIEEIKSKIDEIRGIGPVFERHLNRIADESTTVEMFFSKLDGSICAGLFSYNQLVKEPKNLVTDLPILQIAVEVNDYITNRYPKAYYSLKTLTRPNGGHVEVVLRNTLVNFYIDEETVVETSVRYCKEGCAVAVSIRPNNESSAHVVYDLKPVFTIGEIYAMINQAEELLGKAMNKLGRITRGVNTKEEYYNIIHEAVENEEFSVSKLENE